MKKKIPDHAKLVFKGVLHDIYQWQQEMFDRTFSTFEAVYRRPGLTVIASTEDKKIIVNEEVQPGRPKFYTLPGGNSEENGESFVEGMQRELLEETGYVSGDWKEWFVSDILFYSKMDWTNLFFIAKNCTFKKTPEPDPGENIKVLLLDFADFVEISQRDDFRNREVTDMIAKIKDDPEKLEEFKREIFDSVI